MRSIEEVPFSTTPSAPLKEASRLLLDVASTPPVSGGEWRAAQFIHTFYDRAYNRFRRFCNTLLKGGECGVTHLRPISLLTLPPQRRHLPYPVSALPPETP